MMHDRKALQAGTSHYFGDGFAKAFGIEFTDKNNQRTNPHETSWGVSTRLIGGIIMTHGDNNGLVLPPKVAPVQVVILPVAQHKPGVLDAANALKNRLIDAGLRVKLDDSDNSMGWKCAEYEMKGVPLRVECGPRDLENGECVIVRRTDREKIVVKLDDLEKAVAEQLEAVHNGMFQRAKKNLEDHIFEAHSLEEAKALQDEHGGYIKTMWCGDLECEMAMKEKAGMSSRCIPFAQENLGQTCACCGKSASKMVYWGVAY
jgi:prolyl-tRNA synthetase